MARRWFFLPACAILLVEPKGFPFPACLIQEQARGLMVLAAQLADRLEKFLQLTPTLARVSVLLLEQGLRVSGQLDELLAWLAVFESAVQGVADLFGEPSDFAVTRDHRFAQNSSTSGRHHGTKRAISPKPLWTLWTLLKYF